MSAVRLKVIDLEGGDQPMQTEDGDCVLVFNGEIFNHAELRRELEGLGHRFQSHCDTEVALLAFMQWDTGCFQRFRGMFAMAFWQESRRRLVLARDRLGIKPLYYAIRDGKLYFGSELKAIFEFPEIPRRISPRALSYYLALNYVPTPWTLVEGIEKLEPGFWLEYTPSGERKGQYWRNRFSPRITDMEEACAELDSLLRSAMAEHMVSDVPVGIWASGGLDSSTILHYCAESSSRPLETFSISFPGKQFDESRYVRLLQERYATRHHELDLTGELDLTSAIHDIAYYSDEPSADAGALPVWFLSRMTARHMTVALSGEGADELFGGYQTYLADRYAAWARRLPGPLLHLAARGRGCTRSSVCSSFSPSPRPGMFSPLCTTLRILPSRCAAARASTTVFCGFISSMSSYCASSTCAIRVITVRFRDGFSGCSSWSGCFPGAFISRRRQGFPTGLRIARGKHACWRCAGSVSS